jgi:catechol-2,3-dioxygenase
MRTRDDAQPLVNSLGYVALGVTDLAASVAFYRDVCQLDVTEQREDVAFLRGDNRHHWLRLEKRDTPGLIRVGFEARDARALDEVTRRLEQRSIQWTLGGTIRGDRVSQSIRFEDIDGIAIELYEEMVTVPAPAQSSGINLDLMLHAVFNVRDVAASRNFWTEVLGFRRSDQIEDLAVFMRCGNRYHHSVAFLSGGATAGTLDHLALLVKDIDDVMRMRTLADYRGIPLRHDLVRDGASSAIAVSLRDEANDVGVEFCTGHEQIEDDSYGGRLLMASASTGNVWSAVPGPASGAGRIAGRV